VKEKSLNSENNEEKVETRGRKSILTEIQKTTLHSITSSGVISRIGLINENPKLFQALKKSSEKRSRKCHK
jgi:hypothetical protein